MSIIKKPAEPPKIVSLEVQIEQPDPRYARTLRGIHRDESRAHRRVRSPARLQEGLRLQALAPFTRFI